MGLPMSPVLVVRVQPSFEDSYKKLKVAKLIPRKLDRITYEYFSKSKEELLVLMYLTDHRLASNKQILKLVRKLGCCRNRSIYNSDNFNILNGRRFCS
jgi:hypothetical protein